MNLPIVDNAGKKVDTMAVSNGVFASPMNLPLVAQVVNVYLANQRQAGAKAKTRGDIYGSRRKLWKQKGTGHARHGDKFAPQFVGGGVAHGPTGLQNFRRTVNEKMRQKALFCLLSQKQKQDKLVVVADINKFKKTADMSSFLTRLDAIGNSLVIDDSPQISQIRALRNIAGVKFVAAHSLNALMVARADKLIMTKNGVTAIVSRLKSK